MAMQVSFIPSFHDSISLQVYFKHPLPRHCCFGDYQPVRNGWQCFLCKSLQFLFYLITDNPLRLLYIKIIHTRRKLFRYMPPHDTAVTAILQIALHRKLSCCYFFRCKSISTASAMAVPMVFAEVFHPAYPPTCINS